MPSPRGIQPGWHNVQAPVSGIAVQHWPYNGNGVFFLASHFRNGGSHGPVLTPNRWLGHGLSHADVVDL
jgi:hypothetical protein